MISPISARKTRDFVWTIPIVPGYLGYEYLDKIEIGPQYCSEPTCGECCGVYTAILEWNWGICVILQITFPLAG
jgi:hypothetical protein